MRGYKPISALKMGSLLRQYPIYRGLFPIADAFSDAVTWGA